MNVRIYLTLAILASSGLSVAQGAIILSDSFDTYANQAAFEAAWPPIGTVAPISARSYLQRRQLARPIP